MTEFSYSSQSWLSENARAYGESGCINQASVPEEEVSLSISNRKGYNIGN